MENIYTERVKVWQETEAYSKTLPLPPRSVKIKFKAPYNTANPYTRCSVRVVDQDCLETARARQHCGDNPLVLNLSDDMVAGGCVFTGSGAQEESIWRRTNYCRTLLQDMYPLNKDECVYSQGVTVFRESEAKGHAWLDSLNPHAEGSAESRQVCIDCPYKIDLIACPALRHPPRDQDGNLGSKDVQTLKTKLDLILTVAKFYKHDSVVLGAMGCGAWGNPPAHVAKIFREVLQQDRWGLKAVWVACLNTKDNCNPDLRSKSNYDYFKEELQHLS